MAPIIFDLTEVLLASTGKLRHYGIVRVVEEIANAFVRTRAPVRFAVFSIAHGAFFEVKPELTPLGGVALNVPLGFRQYRVRARHYSQNGARDLALHPLRKVANLSNRVVWRARAGYLPPLNLQDTVLISASRPKLIVEQIDALERGNTRLSLVPLLHDMIPLHENFNHRRMDFVSNFLGDNRIVIERAACVVTNSNFTMREIRNFVSASVLPAPKSMVAVQLAHECIVSSGYAGSSLQQPYILAVGASIGRKNLDVVFEALLILAQRQSPPLRLVLAGAPRKSVIQYLKAPRFDLIRDHVIFRASPEQAELAYLYKGALALVIASRMEGWGLPAGETLWFGTPALCSTAPALREVCGDLGVYFDPDDAAGLASLLNRFLVDKSFVASLRSRIAEARPALRSWNAVARDLMATVVPLAREVDRNLRGPHEHSR